MVGAGNDRHVQHMVKSRPPKKAWTDSYYEETMKLIAAQFGLTKPPALPTDDDRFTVAGIFDRYRTMHRLVRHDLKVQRDSAKKTEWSAGPPMQSCWETISLP